MNDKPTLTLQEVQQLVDLHEINDTYADDGYCICCGEPWPCAVIQLANALLATLEAKP